MLVVNMFRSVLSRVCHNSPNIGVFIPRRNILQDSFKCSEAWARRLDSDILKKIKLDELFFHLEQKFDRSGILSAIDVDIFANAIRDDSFLDELRVILYKLRMTSETSSTLESTHHATIRLFMDHDRTDDLLNLLDDRLNYGIFLDEFSANILLDHFIKKHDFKAAARTASFLMLQEDFLTPATANLCLLSCLSYLDDPQPFYPKEEVSETKVEQVKDKRGRKKVEEVKVRVRYLRNPYFDDHFDIRNENDLVGKTIAMASRYHNNIERFNEDIIGWLLYKKFDKMQISVDKLLNCEDIMVFKETINQLEEKLKDDKYKDGQESIIKALEQLKVCKVSESTLLERVKQKAIEEINKGGDDFVQRQIQAFSLWEQTRKSKLEEQIERLDKAKRIELIQETQKTLMTEEEKLWFFDNEQKIDLAIDNKKVIYPKRWFGKKKVSKTVAEDYVPPEIVKRRK